MKKWSFLLLILPFFIYSCAKSSTNECTYTESALVATPAEIAYLDSTLTASGIIATQHPSGVFYTIDSLGSGANPAICSTVTVKYTGFVLGNPIPFDSYTATGGTAFSLGGVIVGWQKALPILKAGGKITLFIPPSLAYGAAITKNGDGDVIIPANSYLVFNIELISVR